MEYIVRMTVEILVEASSEAKAQAEAKELIEYINGAGVVKVNKVSKNDYMQEA